MQSTVTPTKIPVSDIFKTHEDIHKETIATYYNYYKKGMYLVEEQLLQ